MKISLNIGLNNNPYNHEQIKNLLSNIGTILNSRQVDSTYIGNIEPTSVIIIDVPFKNNKNLVNWIEDLCKITTQEAIAVKNDEGFKQLVYNPNFKGEILKFDENYFVNIV